jgi:hypothetical protein
VVNQVAILKKNFEKENSLLNRRQPKKGEFCKCVFFFFFLLDESFKNKVSRPGDDSQLLTRIKRNDL